MDVDEDNQEIEDDSISGKELKKISDEIAILKQEKDSLNLAILSKKASNSIFSDQKCINDLDKKIHQIDFELKKLKKDSFSLESCIEGDNGEDLKNIGLEKKSYQKQKEELIFNMKENRNISESRRT